MDDYYLSQLTEEYNASRPAYTMNKWLDIFPTAISVARSALKDKIKQDKEYLNRAYELQTAYRKITSNIYKDRWFWEMVVEIVYLPNIKAIEKQIKQNYFTLTSLKSSKLKYVKNDNISEQDIIKAREVPITNFIEVNRMGFSRCPLHTDKTPSLKYYSKTNTFYCYSCGACRDTIDLITKIHNKNFIGAVKFLIGK